MQILLKIVAKLVMGLLGIAILVLLFMAASDVQQAPPNNLIVLADHKYKTYISPECLNPNIDYETDEFEPVTLDIATKTLKYEVDSSCTYDSIWPSRNGFINWIGVKTGLLKPLNWKWNDDGTWKEEVFK